MGEEVSGDAERRLMWMEVIRTVNAAIPRDPDGVYVDGKPPSLKDLPLEERKDIHITQLDTKYFEDLKEGWFTEERAKRYRDEMRNWADIMDRELPEDFETIAGPEGAGWVIQLQGYHYYNSPEHMGSEGSNHIRKYMTTAFTDGNVKLPVGTDENGNPILEEFTFPEMGLTYPLLLDDLEPKLETVPNPEWDPELAQAQMASRVSARPGDDPDFEPPTIQVQKLDFIFQIVWQEQKLSDRVAAKKAAAEAAAAEADAEADAEAPADADTDTEATAGDDTVAVTQP